MHWLVLPEPIVNIRFPVALPPAFLALGLLGFGAAGCQKKPDPQGTRDRPPVAGPSAPPQSAEELRAPLAKIDDVAITLGEFQERINRQSPYIRARYTSLEQKKEFLDSLIRFEVLAKEAARRGLDKDPEVVRTMKQVMIQKLMRDELDAKITADTIADADMKAYYNANLAEYVRPEEVRASAIIIKNRAQAERVAREARGDAGKTNKGFRDLVGKYSQDEDSKLRGGDLRYFDAATKDVPGPVVKAAFALPNIGDVSGIVDAGNGTWYVLKQTGRRKSVTKPFDDAKPTIRNKLFRDKRLSAQKDFVDGLKSAAKIEINEVNLAKVRIDMSQAGADDGHGRDLPPLPLSTATSPPGPPGSLDLGRPGGPSSPPGSADPPSSSSSPGPGPGLRPGSDPRPGPRAGRAGKPEIP
jgi:peptidyl-prolyl cis-trans isomerase C